MLTYVVLMNFTHQGMTTVKDSPKRAQAAKAMIEKLGDYEDVLDARPI